MSFRLYALSHEWEADLINILFWNKRKIEECIYNKLLHKKDNYVCRDQRWPIDRVIGVHVQEKKNLLKASQWFFLSKLMPFFVHL